MDVMPVFIFEEESFEKLIEVEGEDYRRFRGKDMFKEVSFDAFLELWNSVSQDQSLRNHRPEFALGVNSFGSAIYGYAGWNRYVLLNTGELMLIEGSSTKDYIKKARDAGFRIFPGDLPK